MLRSRLVTLLAAAAVGVLFLAGLMLDGGLGAGLMAVVVLLLGLLTANAWTHVPPQRRPLRIGVIVLVAAIAVIKVV